MNSFNLRENSLFKEKYYEKTLNSGFKITVIPKSLPAMTAFLCCDFGAAEVKYRLDGEIFTLPYGTAHFLEHKMFETADGRDSFLDFDAYGGNANAFTSFENTCYYFCAGENFFENLEVLLSSVSSFHCTKKSVEKEKKIIAREIKMYEDLPNSCVSRNLLSAMYANHPLTEPISGRVESINTITKEILCQAYDHFYVPENLSLCICGDVDLERVSEYAEKYFGTPSHKRPETVFDPEPLNVTSEKALETGIVATPLFSMGIKCENPDLKDINFVRRSSALRIAISLAFGRASDFYCQSYAQGLLSERFYAGYTSTRGASYISLSGSSTDPEAVFEKAKAEIRYRKTHFFTEEQILREKKAAYAESITLFDSAEDLTSCFAMNSFFDYDEFDCIEILRDITPQEIKDALDSIDLTKASISIIRKDDLI